LRGADRDHGMALRSPATMLYRPGGHGRAPCAEPCCRFCRRIALATVRRHALAAALLVLATGFSTHPSLADQAAVPGLDLTAPVEGHAPTTYLDLLRLVVPDLAAEGDLHAGHASAGIRTIDADAQAAAAPQPFRIGAIQALDPGGAPDNRLLVLAQPEEAADSAEGYAVLALFELASPPRLLDALNVAFDRFTSFGEPARLPVAKDATLLVTRSTHFNSGQAYVTTVLLLLRGDRLELVDMIFTFDETVCDFERSQVLSLAAASASGGQPAEVTVTVTETTTPAEHPCSEGEAPGPQTRRIAVTYAWNAAQGRYEPSSNALLELAAENAQRF
jgi:hypothetical protein